ncbi:MAG: phage/plasmid primase, P4 family [Pirellulales bacterium]
MTTSSTFLRPGALPVETANIPLELKGLPNFVVWKLEIRKGKLTKVPHDPRTGHKAAADDASTWGTFDEALAAYVQHPGRYAGIGFEFDGTDYMGVDLDACRDPETGMLTPWAQNIITRVGPTYCEVSPSGTGVKLILRGSLPKGAERNRFPQDGATIGDKHPEIEVYDSGRYFTLTGHRHGNATTIAVANGQLDSLYSEWMEKLADDKILNACKKDAKFQKLWGGDLSDYGGDASRGDLALCSMLARRTGPNAARIDKLFRRSGLYREKWERQDYRDWTIGKALEGAARRGARSIDGKADARQMDPSTEARAFLETGKVDGMYRLRFWRGAWYLWSHGAYREVAASEVRSHVVRFLDLRWCRLTSTAVNNVIDHLKAQAMLPGRTEAPAWLNGAPDGCPARDVLVARNGLVNLRRLVAGQDYLSPLTPGFFALSALDYDFAMEAPRPEKWLAFLADLWPDDPESIGTLQEWFGYLLTQDTRLQKILMLVGPKRSGKGTIARVLARLLGTENVAGPTLGSLGGNFGLWQLLGKSLAVISDARLGGRADQAAIVERLLSISGEDYLVVDRKFLEPTTTKLPTRLMLLTNELPRLTDSSGALAGRLVILKLSESWYGQEDHNLTDRLLTERPGILNWAIVGWQRLWDRGHFVQPESGGELRGQMETLSSPVGEFIRECCVLGPDHRAVIADVFGAWRSWCESQGRDNPGILATFGRDLSAAAPQVRRVRLRDGKVRAWAYHGMGLLPEVLD